MSVPLDPKACRSKLLCLTILEFIPPAQQVLRYKGRILEDDEVVGSISIRDNDVINCLDVGPRTKTPSTSSSLIKRQMLSLRVTVTSTTSISNCYTFRVS